MIAATKETASITNSPNLLRANVGDEETRANAIAGWCSARLSKLSDPEHRKAMDLCGLDEDCDVLDFELPKTRQAAMFRNEYRAQSTITGTGGGALIAEDFFGELENALLTGSPVRQVARVIRKVKGGQCPFPTSDDHTHVGRIVTDNTPSVSSNQVSFGAYNFTSRFYSSDMIVVPFELIEDSALDFSLEMGKILGLRISRIQNQHFTTGTGSGQPTGITVGATLGVSAASATAIAADELINLKFSVDSVYRQTGAAWMMHDTTLQAISKLKDSSARYLFTDAGTLLQSPVVTNNDMPTIATGNRSVIYGQLGKYTIRDVRRVRLVMVREASGFAENDVIGFVSYMDSDGALMDAGTHPVKYLQQA